MIVAGTFVPMVASVFHEAGVNAPLATSHHHAFLAVIGLNWLYNGISVPVMLAAYFIVFLAGNAINILSLLSPFTSVDAALKTFRLFLLSTVTITSFANPYVGAAWSLILIIIAYFISGWSFRLSFLGFSFIWDFFTFRRTRFTPAKTANWMFLAHPSSDVPVRTYGKLSADTGKSLVFSYRPWLIFAERTLILPAGNYAVGKGLVYSELIKIEGNRTVSTMLLPPRYRSHEAELAAVYGFAGVRDTGLLAAFAWLKELIGLKPKESLAG
jgi:hypothetical protein